MTDGDGMARRGEKPRCGRANIARAENANIQFHTPLASYEYNWRQFQDLTRINLTLVRHLRGAVRVKFFDDSTLLRQPPARRLVSRTSSPRPAPRL